MRLENLYVGIGEPKLCGEIDINWARELSKKERYLNIKSNEQTVCFIDLNILLAAYKERKDTAFGQA